MPTTPNRSYPYPLATDPAVVPADLWAPLAQIDADVQTLTDRVGAVESDVDDLKRNPATPGGTQPVQAADLLAARLAFGTGDLTVGVAGDSTANDPGDWPRVMCSMLAARFPALRVEHHQWNDAAAAYDPPVIVQEGEGEAAFSGTLLHDTFSRTTNLATPDLGEPWQVLNPGSWVLDGQAARATGAASLTTDTGTRDFTSETTLTIDTTATGAVQSIRWYHGVSDGTFVQITVNSVGVATVYVYRLTGGASELVISKPLAEIGVPTGAAGGQLSVRIESAIQVQTVTVTYGDQSWSHEYTISEAAYAAMASKFMLFPQAAIPGIAITETAVTVADRPATYQTLTVKAGTKGGGTMQYQIDNWDEMFGDEGGGDPAPGGTQTVVVQDRFERTGELVGSTATTGQTWTGTAGTWSVSGGSAGAAGLNAAYLSVPDAVTARFDTEVITASTVAQTLRLGVATRGDATNGVYVALGVSSTGAFSPSAYVRTPTGGYRTLGAIAGHGITSNSSGIQSVAVTITRDGPAFTFAVGGGSATFTITPEEAAELGGMIELQPATPTLTGIRVGEVRAEHTIEVPDTPGTAGSPLDVMIVAHGHNYGALDGPGYQARLDEFADVVAEHRPSTLLLVASQNPEFAPAGNPVRHAERQAAAKLWAKRRGYSYAPVFERFHAQPDRGASWVLADGIHPTPSPGGVPTDGKGSTEWARVIIDSILG